MNYIITKHPEYFKRIGKYNYCSLADMVLPEKIAIDTETTGLQARNCDIFCVQIGTGKDNYLIHMYDNNYEFSDLVPYINGKILVGHNILFDLGFMYKYNFWPREVRDTMLATKILYNGHFEKHTSKKGEQVWIPVRADFGSVMSRELNVKYDKTEQKNIHIVKLSQQSTIEYSFNDVDRLLELEDFLCNKMEEGGFTPTYELHCRYIRALAYIEQCGMPLAPKRWMKKMQQDITNQQRAKLEVEEYIYDHLPQFADQQIDMFDHRKRIHISITSPTQMLRVFKALKIDTKDKDGKDSIEENILKKSKHEFIPIWLKFTNANHRVTTFGQKIYDRIENNRVYTNFNPMVDTARLSTRRGEINFLNFPADKETRTCFACEEGQSMIVCDWSGQETVIAADLSGDKAMTHSVLTGACLHAAFARVLFPELEDLDDDTIKNEHADKRQDAKSPRFAFQYGGSAYTIHQNEGIPLDRAYEIENAFKELHAELYVWGFAELNKAIKQGYIESADGWKLKLPRFEDFKSLKDKIDSISQDQWKTYKIGKMEHLKKMDFEEKAKENKTNEKYVVVDQVSYNFFKDRKKDVSSYFKLRGEYLRLCLNNPVQARGAHQLKLATCILFDWILDNNYQWKILLCNSVHDELVAESPDELKEITRVAVQKAMLEGGNYYLTNLEIKADAKYGASWGEAK